MMIYTLASKAAHTAGREMRKRRRAPFRLTLHGLLAESAMMCGCARVGARVVARVQQSIERVCGVVWCGSGSGSEVGAG